MRLLANRMAAGLPSIPLKRKDALNPAAFHGDVQSLVSDCPLADANIAAFESAFRKEVSKLLLQARQSRL